MLIKLGKRSDSDAKVRDSNASINYQEGDAAYAIQIAVRSLHPPLPFCAREKMNERSEVV